MHYVTTEDGIIHETHRPYYDWGCIEDKETLDSFITHIWGDLLGGVVSEDDITAVVEEFEKEGYIDRMIAGGYTMQPNSINDILYGEICDHELHGFGR